MRSLASTFAVIALAAAADPVPAGDFFRHSAYSAAALSPDGRFVALAAEGGVRGRKGLVVLGIDDPSKSKAVAGFANADVSSVWWVNANRLVFAVTDAQTEYGDQIGQAMYAVDRSGGEVRVLYPRGNPNASSMFALHSVPRDGSNDVIIVRYDYSHRGEPRGTALSRLDTATGRSEDITFGAPDFVRSWALDPRGVPRAAVAAHEGRTRVYSKTAPDAPWTKVSETDTYQGDNDRFVPLAVDSTNTLYVTRRDQDEDTRSLWRIDMAAGNAQPRMLMSLKGYDFAGRLVMGADGRVVGIRYLTDARGVHWFDRALKGIQEKVDALLPGLVNQIDCGACSDPAVVLVRSWADRQPPVFRVYDTRSGTLKVIAESRPWIDPRRMARREMHRIAARDGLDVPVHVTRPPGQSGPAPMVVLVHGGPYVRGGEWEWNAESQFLASRGYVVLEPEYRGSTGFGYRHFSSGWKQWGLAMQDDIADATRWAIDKGLADGKRTCIAGGSYGGYATLMGLARYPELYRCGVEWVGVTDLDLMYTSRWSDMTEMWREYGMPVLVGDRGRDARQLAQTSPVNLASRITQPLLMAYGLLDRRVPIQHGARMRDALAPFNKNVEWVEYADEAHGWWLETNEIDFWRRVERFLAKHLRE
ncbi:MAG: S9 family peptidase [Burkholderiales bacterium]|nr:S9 family peptidase [Burkholderiales bacterium]